MRERLLVTGASAPFMPRGVRLRFDPVRELHVLLAPERVLMPDEVSFAILAHCDGTTCVDEIITALAGRFDATVQEIHTDVIELLQSLADRGYVRV